MFGTKCQWQDNVSYTRPGSYIRGHGHKIESNVKRGNILSCPGCNSHHALTDFEIIWYKCSFWQDNLSCPRSMFISQKVKVTIWGQTDKKGGTLCCVRAARPIRLGAFFKWL